MVEKAGTADECGRQLLPTAQLPIVVAARLSLSFPVLFSAVPLWAFDDERLPIPREARLRRCYFSDGGICSNFPIHLFDSAVPEWPTFGISLDGVVPGRGDPVWMTNYHWQGREETWIRYTEISLLEFLWSVFKTAKDWNDTIASHLPGVRDRIVHCELDSGGGLNLKITAEDILWLAKERGTPAGRKLVDKFFDRNAELPTSEWEEHRWVRFNTFIDGLRERIQALDDATGDRRHGTPLKEQIEASMVKRPLREDPSNPDPGGRALRDEEARDLQILLATLRRLEARINAAKLRQPYKPIPTPSLNIRAPL